jgi:glutaredoxin-related protein
MLPPPPPCGQVVAFVKGTRSAPQCGFSYKMLSILNDMRTDYEVVNVLDEFHNPGVHCMDDFS